MSSEFKASQTTHFFKIHGLDKVSFLVSFNLSQISSQNIEAITSGTKKDMYIKNP